MLCLVVVNIVIAVVNVKDGVYVRNNEIQCVMHHYGKYFIVNKNCDFFLLQSIVVNVTILCGNIIF